MSDTTISPRFQAESGDLRRTIERAFEMGRYDLGWEYVNSSLQPADQSRNAVGTAWRRGTQWRLRERAIRAIERHADVTLRGGGSIAFAATSEVVRSCPSASDKAIRDEVLAAAARVGIYGDGDTQSTLRRVIRDEIAEARDYLRRRRAR